MRRNSATALLCILAILVLPSESTAQRNLDFRRFDAELIVHRDGRLSVTERITVRFQGEWNGIYRRIPVEYGGPHGSNYTLRLAIQAVTNEAGDCWSMKSAGKAVTAF